jgi:hypothetical protein
VFNPKFSAVYRLALLSFFLVFAAVLLWPQVAPVQSVRPVGTNCRPKSLFLPVVDNHSIAYWPGTGEVEPNDTYQEANGPLRSSVAYQGLPDDQRDFFSFYMGTGGQIVINLNGHTGQQVQLQLFYQSTGNRVAFDSDGPYQVSYTGAAGWYYIYIFTGSGTNNIPYSLTVTYAVLPTQPVVTPVATPTCPPGGATSTPTRTPSFTSTHTPGPSPTVTHTNTPGRIRLALALLLPIQIRLGRPRLIHIPLHQRIHRQ